MDWIYLFFEYKIIIISSNIIANNNSLIIIIAVFEVQLTTLAGA